MDNSSLDESRNFFEKEIARIKILGKDFINAKRTLEREGDGYADTMVDLMWTMFKTAIDMHQCPDCGYQVGDPPSAQVDREELQAMRVKMACLERENRELHANLRESEESDLGALEGAKMAWETVLSNIKSGMPIEGLEITAKQNIRGLADLLEKKAWSPPHVCDKLNT